MNDNLFSPDYLFETSWEVCNKVGGIHTVLSTKALTLSADLRDNFILIGPDVWRDSHLNHEFVEDEKLFKNWKAKAADEGLSVRIGRWNIAANPIVFLVDFTSFIPQKDEIFKKFWELYKLDSLNGPWDYVEPALFGYAAGRLIESFANYNLTIREKVVAQFHEWMTGTGILYLEDKMPQIATVFTTHATVMGRCIAGNGLPLYGQLEKFDGDQKAKEMQVVAKQSLEKISAQVADAFTTVSSITAKECKQFLEKEVDLVTPNGFEDSFVPEKELFVAKREKSRAALLKVAEALIGEKLPADALLVANSGRYEYRNKGLDAFINSLCMVNKQYTIKKTIVAFILVPANHYGPQKKLLDILAGNSELTMEQKTLTHGLHDAEWDPVLLKIKECPLLNATQDKVKLIFVPSYLNGDDGLFNIPYYDLLIGFDLTVFPSYYEPWGYTPLESIAFHIPTITTSLAGFGLWVKNEYSDATDGVEVVERTDTNDLEMTAKIAEMIAKFANKDEEELKRAREKAYYISRIALWKNFIKYYYKAYEVALRKVVDRAGKFIIQLPTESITHVIKSHMSNEPIWNRIIVESHFPEKLNPLHEISKNLWWCWNYEAEELFDFIDHDLWRQSHCNPIAMLQEVSFKRFLELERDPGFITKLNGVYSRFQAYMGAEKNQVLPQIAYFSMEFGFHDSIKIFSGGLGILAGDYLKEASDSNVNMVGIGLLYRYGYFKQSLSVYGDQLAYYEPQRFSHMPIEPVKNANGEFEMISIELPGRRLYARIWKVAVGRISLYLLDTDFELNRDMDKSITHQLYGGGEENRFKQELLLGIGGIRLLHQLNITPELFHCNEGHAAFIGIERMNRHIHDEKLSFAESVEIVRSSTLFTTHTPVPAGHDSFPEDLMRTYIAHYPARLNISWDEFINLGKLHNFDKTEKFSMSYLAVSLSQEVNGVSMLHGKVSRDMFQPMWPGFYPEELHIGYVTNGVHYETWTAKAWQELYLKEFGADFLKDLAVKENWEKIYRVPDETIWKIRQSQRKIMIDYLRGRFEENWIKRLEDPRKIIEITSSLDEKCLTIGFARRFATYKRAHLLFKNIDRLKELLNNPKMPVQLIFAGKAHPNDKAGQDLIRYIVEISKQPDFLGKVLFMENYDIELAKKMVQGVDIWMNTPTRPLEASGTSGEKAVMNGCLHFSVLDGWWVEGYQKDAGWALKEEQTYTNNDFQDDLDAETIYSLLEEEIIPAFYERDDQGTPHRWVSFIKNSIAKVAPNFTTKRMMDDYYKKFYNRLTTRSRDLKNDDFDKVKHLSAWKKKVSRGWDSVEVLAFNLPEESKNSFRMGEKYSGDVVLNMGQLHEQDITIELVVANFAKADKMEIVHVEDLKLDKVDGKIATYKISVIPIKPGAFNFGLRILPKHPDLPHRMDFAYVRWI